MGPRAIWWLTSQFCIFVIGSLMFEPCAIAQNLAAKAAATAFRVDTDIFLKENSKEPDSQTLTLFKEGVYYDFALDRTQAVTVIDPHGRRIILLSPPRKLKTTLETATMLDYMKTVQETVQGNNELTKMLAATQQVDFDPMTNLLSIGDKTMSYESTLQPAKDLSMTQQYADFADWSARLNTFLPPHHWPFLRFELNRQIATRGLFLPDTVRRITKHHNSTVVVKTKMIAVATLSKDDEAKLHNVGELLHTCEAVSKEQFFNPTPLTSQTNVRGGARK